MRWPPRLASLESELARIRPVYEAACKVRAHDRAGWPHAGAYEDFLKERARLGELLDAVLDAARSPQ